ncbi:tRNA lysidine(34) synthetase TilS [Mesorhizobium sp. J428]|uniref:tRNA lysidine(34) synthetase TilS n=1 Tax=Mesorhizobium sp. J428 TaxID=2898440 RepID=UPI002150D6E5|nr:tRNA lysidine(34) synthetase TilS [Mesorhizobium sp. J428]MCR5856642.1 tRNA lysidine(34) synthetase TilS [Mesorhizobium sp. J428]
MLTAASGQDPAGLAPDRLFAGIDFTTSPAVVVAVSGGGDSIALLHLLSRHLVRTRIVAVTVDHALRPDSAREAEDVGAFCATLGVSHLIRAWHGDKPATGLSAAARDARYRLLAEAADDVGATLLLTGHTEDDQAETVAMRAERGEGRGLAGMAPDTLLDGRLWLVRPLLATRRAALRDYLRAEGIGWVDDPTNEDAAYERVRARRRLADPAAFARAIETAREGARERERLGEAAAALIATCALPAPGLVRLAANVFRAAPRDAATYALRLLLATAGGGGHLPDDPRTAALLDRFGEPAFRASLARATVERRGDAIFLYREARGLPEPGPALNGQIWDGRFRLGNVEGETIGPAGRFGGGRADEASGVPPALARAAAAARPALFRSAECLGPLDGRSDADSSPLPTQPFAVPLAAPFARILPAFDLAPARALMKLVGGELPPPPPYAGHTAPEA